MISRGPRRANVVGVAYLISGALAAACVVVLCMMLRRLAGPVRQLAATTQRSRADLADRAGLLTARVAALRVALDRRRRRRNAG
jgi:membrane protein implicated in regulation of membrane protease activity